MILGIVLAAWGSMAYISVGIWAQQAIAVQNRRQFWAAVALWPVLAALFGALAWFFLFQMAYLELSTCNFRRKR